MKKIVYTILLFLSLLSGCSEENIQDFFPSEYHKIFYIKESGEQDVTLYNSGNDMIYTLTVCKAGSNPSLTANINIAVMPQSVIDEDYAVHESRPFQIIPEGSYRIEPQQFTFSASETYKQINVILNPNLIQAAMNAVSGDTQWLLPLKAVSANDSINNDKNTYVLRINEVVTPSIGFKTTDVQLYTHDYTTGAFSTSVPFGLLTVENVWEVSANITVDKDYVTSYNSVNNTNYQIPADGTYIVPTDITLAAHEQEAFVDISISNWGGGKSGYFMLPIRLTDVSLFKLSADASLYVPIVRLIGKRFDRSTWTAEACSQEITGEGSNNGMAQHAIDGNVSTFWHTMWSGSSAACLGMPHWLILDTQNEHEFTQVGIVQRSSDGVRDVRDFNVYVSSDKENWVKIGSGNCINNTNDEQIFDIIPTRGRYLKFEFVNSWRGDNICAAEFYAYGED